MTMTWLSAVDTIRSARNPAAGKPLQNNTRLHQRGEGDKREFGVVLHGTEVVTINSDGTYTLRSGGYQTVTTLDRIRSYAPVNRTLFSEKGSWYVRIESDPSDPQPVRVDREIPKPFEASDPGPEPVKNDAGCQAGSMMGTEHVNETVHTFVKDVREDDIVDEDDLKKDRYEFIDVKRTWTSWVFYGEDGQSWQNTEWNSIDADKTHTTYAQCPHCQAFDAEHEGWRIRMHGPRYGFGSIDQGNGYKVYAEMMEMFGTQEAWQEAYIADFRARRAYLKADREWDERNRVPFYDGIVVNSEGYAFRKRKSGPSKTKLAKHERKVERVKKMIDRYISEYIDALRAGMPMPSGGDCWYCALRTTEGETMGDIGDNDHLFSHIEERYYVPSLAVNALRERGYKDVGIYMWLDMDADAQRMGKPHGRYENVRRDIRAYMRKRMVPAAPTK